MVKVYYGKNRQKKLPNEATWSWVEEFQQIPPNQKH